MAPMAKVVATLEPDTAANIMHVKTQDMARPPCTRPTMDFARSTKRCEMPPAAIKLPARIKNGIAISGNLSIPINICCGTSNNGRRVKNSMPIIEASTIEIAIGTPKVKSTISDSPITIFMRTLLLWNATHGWTLAHRSALRCFLALLSRGH